MEVCENYLAVLVGATQKCGYFLIIYSTTILKFDEFFVLRIKKSVLLCFFYTIFFNFFTYLFIFTANI